MDQQKQGRIPQDPHHNQIHPPEETPVLDAFLYAGDRKRIHLVAWCPYCTRWHWHGAGERPGDGNGHRVAHCSSETSPYLRGGYDLREVGDISELAMRAKERHVGRARKRLQAHRRQQARRRQAPR